MVGPPIKIVPAIDGAPADELRRAANATALDDFQHRRHSLSTTPAVGIPARNRQRRSSRRLRHAYKVVSEKSPGFVLRITRRRLVVFEPSPIRSAAGL
jgi:hypothetical protein